MSELAFVGELYALEIYFFSAQLGVGGEDSSRVLRNESQSLNRGEKLVKSSRFGKIFTSERSTNSDDHIPRTSRRKDPTVDVAAQEAVAMRENKGPGQSTGYNKTLEGAAAFEST